MGTSYLHLTNLRPKRNALESNTLRSKLWRPFWHHPMILIAFVFLFSFLFISLLILWNYDQKNNGIPITISKSHYSWKYGPTVILTVIVSLWTQVDYYTKLLQPWGAMKARTTSSSKSLLLDYISPISVQTLFKAARNRHFSVALSVLILSLLQLAIFLSTGLLQSESTLISGKHLVTINTRFDMSKVDETLRHQNLTRDSPDWISHINSSPRPAYALQSILQGNIQYPQGTQARNAFQTIDPPADLANLTGMSAIVETFTPDIKCETPLDLVLDAQPNIYPHYDWYENIKFTFKNRVCYSDWRDQVNTGSIIYGLQIINCQEPLRTTNKTRGDQMSTQNETELDQVLFFLITEAVYPYQHYSNGSYAVLRQSATACEVRYKIERGTLTQDLVTSVPQSDLSNLSLTSSHIAGLNGTQLLSIALGAAEATGFLKDPYGLFTLLKSSWNDSKAWNENLFDPDTLRKTASDVLQGLCVQIIHDQFVSPDNATIPGTVTYFEDRLRFQVAFLWPIVVLMAIISVLSVVFLLSRPGAVVSQDPGIIGTHAAILSSSRILGNLIRAVGDMRTSELEKSLDGSLFKTSTNRQEEFSIMVMGESFISHKQPWQPSDPLMGHRSSPENTNIKPGPWIPFTFTYPFLSLLFILPTLAIGTLEVLYLVAKKNQGLTNADDNTFQTLSIYVSAGITFTIAATFSSFNFTAASFSPYYALSLSRSEANHSVLVNFFGSIPPITLYRTLKERHYSVSLSSIAGMISSALTIVVSGLWITNQSTIIITDFEATQTTAWDLNWIHSATDDGGASSLLNLLRQNLSIAPPTGIWDDLVFPEWNSRNLHDVSSQNTTDSIKLSLSALRPELTCDFSLQTAVPRDRGLGPGISKQFELPENCHWRDGDSTGMEFNLSYFEVDTLPIWTSAVFDVPTIPWNGTNLDLFFDYGLSKVSNLEARMGNAMATSLNGCPSFFIFNSLTEGNFSFDDLYLGNTTTLMCHQKIQQVQTSVVLKSEAHGKLEVSNLLSAPVPDEQTAIYLTYGPDNSSSFQYRIEPHLARNLSQPLQYRYHPFFSLITPGNFTEVFLDYKSLDEYKAAVNKAYKSYMVHVINSSIFRKNVTDSSHEEAPLIKGTIHNRVGRLTIDHTSKLVLQIMLSIMLLLEAGAVWKMNLRGTLPRKPYSIASIMGFLAGSSICEPTFMPKGAEWMNKEELSRLFGDRTLGLGWWDDDHHDTGNDETEHPKNLRYGIDFGEPRERSFRAGRMNE